MALKRTGDKLVTGTESEGKGGRAGSETEGK